MKRPFVAVVSCYAAGILLGALFQPPLPALFAASFAVLILCFTAKKFQPVATCVLLALLGWTNLVLHTAVIAPDDLRLLAGNRPALATLRGTLAETPRLKITGRDDEAAERSLVQIGVHEMRDGENWRPAFGEIVATVPGALPESFFAGQSVEVAGVLARPPPPLAEGLFDYRAYLQTRGIYYELKTASSHDWQLRDTLLASPPLTDRFLTWSRRTLAMGLPAEDQPLRLLWAMTLGWRTAFTGEVGEPFLRAGTMHLFAIDGLRIALISGMLVALLRLLQISRAWCGLMAVPAIWFYTAATGWEPSAIRASVMMTIVLGGWSLKRPVDLINSLAAAAFIILVWEPRQLFEASFQLSFLVVLVIGLLTPRLNHLSDGLLKQDPLLPAELLPRWRRTLLLFLRGVARYCSLSFAAWIGSIPLSAKYFHLFSPVSTLANILAVPLGTLALMCNLGALAGGAWFRGMTELFNHAAWFFMSAMTDVSEGFTKIPGAYFYVAAPSWISIAIYYGVLLILLGGGLKTARRKIFGAGTLALITAIYLWDWKNSTAETELTILPLNGGHAVFVDAAGRKNDWLVNCGNENAVAFPLKEFLRAQGVNHLPRLALTVGDARETGGAVSLDELFGIGELWTSPVHFHSGAYNRTVSEFERPPARHKIFGYGKQFGVWQVLWPTGTNSFPRAEDDSLVLLGDFSGRKILLLSDLGRDGQSELLGHTNDLRADILVAGLPDTSEPLCNAMIQAVQPKLIVVADSEFPASRRAGPALKARLAQANIPVVYTRDSGAVRIVTGPAGWTLETMDGQKFNSAAASGSRQPSAPAE